MALESRAPVSAADVVNCLRPEALSALLSAYGEDWRANRIARAIYAARPIVSTTHLACVVEGKLIVSLFWGPCAITHTLFAKVFFHMVQSQYKEQHF